MAGGGAHAGYSISREYILGHSVVYHLNPIALSNLFHACLHGECLTVLLL